MDNKKLYALMVFSALILVLVAGGVVADGAVNISILVDNNTIYSHTNNTVVLNWTINNASGTVGGTPLAGLNFSLILDGASYGLVCNGTANGGKPTPYVNISSGCLGDGAVNRLYLNISEGPHTVIINSSYGYGAGTEGNQSLAGFINSTFHVTNFDSLAFVASTTPDYGNLSANYITVNVTYSSIFPQKNNKNIRLGLARYFAAAITHNTTYGSSNSSSMDSSTVFDSTSNTSSNHTIKVLTNNHYTYNVTLVYNISSNVPGTKNGNYTITRHIILDTFAPNITYSCSGWYSEPDVELNDAAFACSCSATDENATKSFTTAGAVDVTTEGLKGTSCTIRDSAGNNKTSGNINYNVITLSDGSTSSGGSSGGSSGSGSGSPTVITGSTYNVNENQFKEGTSAQLKVNDGFKVTFKSSSKGSAEVHTVKVTEIEGNSAVIVIASDPLTMKMNVGENKNVDVDGDGIYDIMVTLESIADGKANIEIIETSGNVPSGEGPISGGDGLEQQPTTDGGEETDEKKSSSLIWIILLVVIIVVVVVVLSMRKKRK